MQVATGHRIFTFLALFALVSAASGVELPPEQSLWAGTKPKQVIEYDAESMRTVEPPASSPSRSNRVFSCVSKPTYTIHKADQSNGVGLVICPGGGYRDVWLDREGHDLGIWLAKRGVTSLVLKYRTNSGPSDEERKYTWDEYLPAAEADARRGIRVLRQQAKALQLDPTKIGICGFSAGGHLALIAGLYEDKSPNESDVRGTADFAGLLYPWLRDDYSEHISQNAAKFPPVFIMNARDDRATPADKCVKFYSQLLDAGANAELHIFSKGSHGFDLGDGRGDSAAMWKDSFLAWMRDSGLIASK